MNEQLDVHLILAGISICFLGVPLLRAWLRDDPAPEPFKTNGELEREAQQIEAEAQAVVERMRAAESMYAAADAALREAEAQWASHFSPGDLVSLDEGLCKEFFSSWAPYYGPTAPILWPLHNHWAPQSLPADGTLGLVLEVHAEHRPSHRHAPGSGHSYLIVDIMGRGVKKSIPFVWNIVSRPEAA
jgi:hypothetical protein